MKFDPFMIFPILAILGAAVVFMMTQNIQYWFVDWKPEEKAAMYTKVVFAVLALVNIVLWGGCIADHYWKN